MATSVNLGWGPSTVKYLMFFFNLIFFLSGLGLIIIGGVAQGFFREYLQFFDDEYKSPGIGLIILGSIILFISFFGCCGAQTNNVCMLRVFAFLLGAMLICEVAGGISIAFLKSDIEDVVTRNMNETMQEYGQNGTLVTSTWDDLQKEYHCCGTWNYLDWAKTNFSEGHNVPDSCCKEIAPGCGEGALDGPLPDDKIYTNVSCSQALKSSALHNLGAIVGGTVALGLIQIIGIWMACCLINAVRANYELI